MIFSPKSQNDMILQMDKKDENLIEDYLGGDDLSLKLIIDKYTQPIYSYISRLAGKDSAEDLTQDVFIKVWKNLKNFDTKKASFKTWIYNIARNTTIDYLRKKKSISFSSLYEEDKDLVENIPDDLTNQENIFIKNEDVNFLKEAISLLPAHYKEILVLYYENEMTFKEIGGLLDKPLNTVKSYHRRAIIKLKQELKGKNN